MKEMTLDLLYFNLEKCFNKIEKKEIIIKIGGLVISQWHENVNKFKN